MIGHNAAVLAVFLALFAVAAIVGGFVPKSPNADPGVYMPGPDNGAWPD